MILAVNSLAAPLGFLWPGQVLEHSGVVLLFADVVLGITWVAVVLAALVLRLRDRDAVVPR